MKRPHVPSNLFSIALWGVWTLISIIAGSIIVHETTTGEFFNLLAMFKTRSFWITCTGAVVFCWITYGKEKDSESVRIFMKKKAYRKKTDTLPTEADEGYEDTEELLKRYSPKKWRLWYFPQRIKESLIKLFQHKEIPEEESCLRSTKESEDHISEEKDNTEPNVADNNEGEI